MQVGFRHPASPSGTWDSLAPHNLLCALCALPPALVPTQRDDVWCSCSLHFSYHEWSEHLVCGVHFCMFIVNCVAFPISSLQMLMLLPQFLNFSYFRDLRHLLLVIGCERHSSVFSWSFGQVCPSLTLLHLDSESWLAFPSITRSDFSVSSHTHMVALCTFRHPICLSLSV